MFKIQVAIALVFTAVAAVFCSPWPLVVASFFYGCAVSTVLWMAVIEKLFRYMVSLALDEPDRFYEKVRAARQKWKTSR